MLGVFLGRTQNSFRNAGEADPVSASARSAVRPATVALASASDTVRDFFGGIFSARSLVLENRRLEGIEQAQALYEQSIARLEREIERLRRMVDLPPIAGRKRVATQIIGYFPHENRITVSGGKDRGFAPGMPVVTGLGLLGVIQNVEERASQATLISAPKPFSIGALALRDPPSAGLLYGESADTLILDLERFQAPIEIGDLVVTSGYSATIPRGIPIGKIVQVENNPAFGTRRAQVFPMVQVGSVREVFVLK